MRIRVSQSGGFAGIPIVLADVETATMPATEADRLESLVREGAFFKLPARVESDGTDVGADVQLHYEVMVEDVGRRHTVTFSDDGGASASAALGLRELVAAVTRRDAG